MFHLNTFFCYLNLHLVWPHDVLSFSVLFSDNLIEFDYSCGHYVLENRFTKEYLQKLLSYVVFF